MVFEELEFYRTRGAGPLNRCNERYKRIIQANQKYLEGKRVLDLGSHDGRWQWAALRAGATHVTGIEYRQSLIDLAKEKVLNRFPPDQWSTRQGDVFEQLEMLAEQGKRFDTVLCLGLFYHIMDHYRMMNLLSALNPECIVMDSGFMNSQDLHIKVIKEDSESPLNAAPEAVDRPQSLAGYVSIGLMNEFCRRLGWKPHVIPWKQEDLDSTENLQDYLASEEGNVKRLTIRLTRD